MIKSDEVKAYAMLAAGAVGIFLIWRTVAGAKDIASKATQYAGEAAATVGGWVNPAADTNLAYRAVNAIGGAASSSDAGKNADGSWTLGGWWFDVTNPATAQAVKDVTSPYVYNSTTINATAQKDAAAVDDYQMFDAWGNYTGEPPKAWTGAATGNR